MKVIKEESKVLGLLKIDDDLFTCETPFGMVFNEFKRLSSIENDLFTYEFGVVKDFYFQCLEQQLDDLENGDLDVYERKVCYDECEKIYVEVVIFINKRLDSVIDTWLIQSYKRQFEDYMEIKKKEVHGLDADMKYDPSNVDFVEWIILSEDDYDRGCRKPSDLEDGFYRDTIKHSPEYVTGMDDEGEVTLTISPEARLPADSELLCSKTYFEANNLPYRVVFEFPRLVPSCYVIFDL
nr:hypothetical protein [Tanacetum cinerariifolium]